MPRYELTDQEQLIALEEAYYWELKQRERAELHVAQDPSNKIMAATIDKHNQHLTGLEAKINAVEKRSGLKMDISRFKEVKS